MKTFEHRDARRARGAAGLAGLAAMAATLAADATPSPGATLPAFTVADITGREHHSRELAGRPTLVLAMTDSDADAQMRAWGAAATRRLSAGVRRVQLVSLDLAFFVPTATVRSAARDRSPEHAWRDTWLERDGELAEVLGLPDSEVPWAIALDERGRVLAVAHCDPSSPAAERVWQALAR